jgi:hypothetical protein
MQAVRSVCLYSSGISNAIVKTRFSPDFMRRAWLAGIVQKFSRASRIGKFSFAPALPPGKLCEIDRCLSVRPGTLSHWNIDASGYTEWYTCKREPPCGASVFPFWQKPSPPSYSRLPVPRVAPPSNPLLQLTFCGTRLRSTGQFRQHFPPLPDRFCACDGVWPVRRETTRGEI